MAESAAELNSFVTKFADLWQSGRSARLSLECVAGEATINLQLRLGILPLQPQQEPHHRAERRAGPSRLRRRARRAQARALAAEQAAASSLPKLSEAEQVCAPNLSRADVAVQATVVPPARANAAVQVELPPPAAQVGQPDQQCVPVPTVQAGTVSPEQHHVRRDGPPHPQHVLDMFCPDSQYGQAQHTQQEMRRKKERQDDLDSIMSFCQQ